MRYFYHWSPVLLAALLLAGCFGSRETREASKVQENAMIYVSSWNKADGEPGNAVVWGGQKNSHKTKFIEFEYLFEVYDGMGGSTKTIKRATLPPRGVEIELFRYAITGSSSSGMQRVTPRAAWFK